MTDYGILNLNILSSLKTMVYMATSHVLQLQTHVEASISHMSSYLSIGSALPTQQ